MLRVPHIALRPFVKDLWIADHARPAARPRFTEFALPDGYMHVVIRLSGDPIRILDETHPAGRNYGYGVIGGARASYYSREVSGPTHAIGATLLPGAAQALFGLNAIELANRHTSLSDVWGVQAEVLRERLLLLARPHLQLELFEMTLLARIPLIKGIHPAVAQALADVGSLAIGSMVTRSGLSHRRFVELFSQNVGLTPKRFARVLRFRRMLHRLAHDPKVAWADLAADMGYSDQAHFNREFREFAGLTPEEYRRAAPISPGHVLLSEGPNEKRRR